MKINSYGKIDLKLKVTKNYFNTNFKTSSLSVPFFDNYDILSIDKKIDENEPLFIDDSNKLDRINNSIIETKEYFFKENKYLNLDKNIKINLKKNIPIGSGLGMRISNAISTYKLLYNYYNIPINSLNFKKFANNYGIFGSFFIYLKPVQISNKGELKFLDKNVFDLKNKIKLITNSDIIIDKEKVLKQYKKHYKYYKKNTKNHANFYNNYELACYDVYPELYKRFLNLKKEYKYIIILNIGSSFICIK